MDGLIEMFNWVATFVALTGAFLISKQNFKGFYFWVFSNSFFTFYNLLCENYAGGLLFFTYLLITINGIHNTSKA